MRSLEFPAKHSRARMLRHAPLVVAVFVMALTGGCSKHSDPRQALLVRANDHFAAERYGEAEKDYRAVLQVPPTEPMAVRQLAIIYQKQGQLPQAYPLLKKTAELYPNDAEVQLALAKT